MRSINKNTKQSNTAVTAIIRTGNKFSPIKKSYTISDATDNIAASTNLALSGKRALPKKIVFLYRPSEAKITNIIGTKNTVVRVKSKNCDSNV